MKLQYIRAFIVLLAGLIALIINMCVGRQITISLLIVLIVILIFYVIGTLVIEILDKGMVKSEPDEVKQGEPYESVEVTEEENAASVNFDEEDDEEI